MSFTLYYSPHATSVDNEIGHASGHADVLLSEAGHDVAVELGAGYADIDIDAVFSSDLQRAVATVEIAFARRDIPKRQDARLREIDYGELTQHPVGEIHPAVLTYLRTPFPGGQSMAEVVDNVGAFLREVMAEFAGGTVVVIGHMATKRAIEHWVNGTELDDILKPEWPWLDVPIWRYEITAAMLAL